MTKEFENHLEAHPWRGNIRELKNVIESAVIMMENSTLSEEYLPYEILSHQIVPENNNGSIYALNNFERSHIQKVLINTNWDKPQAAKMLDISISTLYRKIEEFMLLPTEHKLN
jgi:DNA-binding NtrC family response regulator